MQVKWLIDRNIIKDTPSEILPDIIRESGNDVHIMTYDPFTKKIDPIPFKKEDCVVVYGTYNFVRALGKGFTPGAFGVSDQTKCNIYMTYLPHDILLNQDFVMTSWGDFKRRKEFWYKIFDSKEVFIRPNSGAKSFTGTIIPKKDWDHEIRSMDTLTSVDNEQLILVCPPKEILAEYRFVIADNEVIAGSRYSWNDQLINGDQYRANDTYIKKQAIPSEAQALAQVVAGLDWQLDTCYTCDVALTVDGPKVVELNSFACAGLYDCDLKAIVTGINKAAIKDLTGF
jgi:hypothetical protein